MKKLYQAVLFVLLCCLTPLVANAQSFRVQCPSSTITHPNAANNNSEPAYTAPTNVNGAIKCQQISGGDGFSTMGDGTQTYMFSFGPLSGLSKIANGQPGTDFPSEFNVPSPSALLPGAPATMATPSSGTSVPIGFGYNGAVGLTADLDALADGKCVAPCLDGHVDPRPIIDVGVLNGNIPAPLFAIDEDDEFFLTLTNVGMIMRPDLFEQHTVHFHGYPNASSFYDGVPDASVAINIGGSFTYYYLAPDAGTYFWHCHITPPEHLQMGMVGQLYVRPRQDRVPTGTTLYTALSTQQGDLRTACRRPGDNVLSPNITASAVTTAPVILCANPLPAINTQVTQGTDEPGNPQQHAHKDGDGSTAYHTDDALHHPGFDPNFH